MYTSCMHGTTQENWVTLQKWFKLSPRILSSATDKRKMLGIGAGKPVMGGYQEKQNKHGYGYYVDLSCSLPHD